MKKLFDLAVEKIGLSGIFLALVALLYLVFFFLDPEIFYNSVLFSADTILKILPVLVLVFFLIFLSNAFLGTSEMNRHLGEEAGLKGWFLSILGGIISSGPIYMWYPLLSDLKDKGMKKSFISAFLYSRAIKIPLLPLMVFYFGMPFTVIFNLLLLAFSALNGYFAEKILNAD